MTEMKSSLPRHVNPSGELQAAKMALAVYYDGVVRHIQIQALRHRFTLDMHRYLDDIDRRTSALTPSTHQKATSKTCGAANRTSW